MSWISTRWPKGQMNGADGATNMGVAKIGRNSMKRLVPPVIRDVIKWMNGEAIEFVGSYSSWERAAQEASGYDDETILAKVRAATNKVKNGEAAFERDSIFFDAPQYPFPLLAVLLRAAVDKGSCLTVLDFGGALGSSYYQCREFLAGVEDLRWCVVEQSHYVHCGRESFECENLRFFESIEECVIGEAPNVALLSGVLQYLEKPLELLATVADLGADYVVVDRTPFSVIAEERLTVQLVSESLYKASYPAWLFNEETIREKMIKKGYVLIAEFDAVDGMIGRGRNRALFKGLIFKKLNVR